MTRSTFTKLAAVPLVCTALLYTGVATLGQTPPPKATSKAKSVCQGDHRPEYGDRRGASGASGCGRGDGEEDHRRPALHKS